MLFVYRCRNGLAALPLVYAFFFSRPTSGTLAWALAATLCIAGALLRAWSRAHNTYARGRKKALATAGPYGIVRNPLYIGNLLLIAGVGLVSGLEWRLPLVLFCAFLVYAIAVRHEEARLREKYGEAYESYAGAVPPWWPRRPLSLRPGWIETANLGVLALQLLLAAGMLLPFAVKVLDRRFPAG